MSFVANEPEDFARALRERFSIAEAVELYDLASKIGLTIREVDARGFEGALVRASNKPNGIIALKSSIREPGRKRFTIAHEFGHYVLPGHGITGRTCKGEDIQSKGKRVRSHEAAANLFASELLLPTAQVKPLVQTRLASIETAEFLSSKFETSLTAALLKSSEVTNERCCVIRSKNEIIEWAWPNAAFKHFIGSKERLTAASLASGLAAGCDDTRVCGLVAAEAWLDDHHLKNGAEIYEDSVFQSHYNTVLTILTINEPLSDEQFEDEDSLLEDLDPEEFTLGRRTWPGKR
jgi:Zn-dependent peptidase ImmA (M78 family)